MADHQDLVLGHHPNDLDNESMNQEELMYYCLAFLLLLLTILLLLPAFLLLLNLGFFAVHLLPLRKFIERV